MPTLTIEDRGSVPSGIEVTHDLPGVVSGIVLLVARVSNEDGFASLSPGVALPGGTASIDLDPGSYLVMGQNPDDLADPTPIYPVLVTDGTETPATRSRAVIAARVQSLGLPVNVYEQWNAIDLSNVEEPAIILSVDNVQETAEKSFNQTDDIGRPAKVSIIDTISKTDHTRLPLLEMVRYRIEKAFRGQQLPIPESVICRVEYNAIVDPTLPPLDGLVSEFVIRHITREYRGP